MRKISLFSLLILLASFSPAISQSGGYHWFNPAESSFPVIGGQGWHKGLAEPYDRLPAKAQKTVRPVVWHLSTEGAGLMIRFRSNAPDIRVRYIVTERLNMPHMPSTGVSGVDLYALNKDGGWEWAAGKYSFGDTIEYHFSSLKHGYVREYHLYLPLYNHVKWMEIGAPDSSELTPLPVSPNKPVVIYGTSIAQGACASRPGKAWTALLGRALHRPVINLAFSGNGRLEPEVVSLLTELDPQIYVVDCLPNMTGFPFDTTKARLIKTVTTLRKAHPSVPVLIAEDADGNINYLNENRAKAYNKVNQAGMEAFEEMKASGVEDIYYLSAQEIGFNSESTVEGTHPNDEGMRSYATAYEAKIREILHEPVGPYSTTQPVKQYRSLTYDWNLRHLRELEMNKTNPPRIVFLGNSITHYWGGEPSFKVHRGEDSWNQYFKPAGVRNLGFSWDRIENVLWRVYHGEIDGYKTRQVLINIGTNNLAYNTDTEIIAGLKLLIQAVKERQPQAKVLLIGIYPRLDGEARVAALNKKLILLAGEENVNYADPGVGLLDSTGKHVVTSLFIDGKLHPNDKGYQIIARALKPYLVR